MIKTAMIVALMMAVVSGHGHASGYGDKQCLAEAIYYEARQAVDIAALLTTTEVEVVGLEGATHYHADWVKPSWATAFERRQKIGSHIFYAQK